MKICLGRYSNISILSYQLPNSFFLCLFYQHFHHEHLALCLVPRGLPLQDGSEGHATGDQQPAGTGAVGDEADHTEGRERAEPVRGGATGLAQPLDLGEQHSALCGGDSVGW